MARRKEVFESKVLQRLYPAAPKLEKEPSPPRVVEAKKTFVKRKASQEETGDAGKTQIAVNPGRRMYTVLPQPDDYRMDLEKSVTLPQLESINSAEDPAEESDHDGDEDTCQDKEEEDHKRKRRKRKRKPDLHEDTGNDGAAPASESSTVKSQTSADEGGERISKNKKRKLKKKRHKEKLLSMGLMPRATALEFTYQKDGEEEVENERRAAEVSDFLRTTMEIYMSDCKRPPLADTLGDLLSSVASGREAAPVLEQLLVLKAFVQQRETDKLERALEELFHTSPMSAEQTTAVISLFQYWITDILPMQGDEKTGLSTTHP